MYILTISILFDLGHLSNPFLKTKVYIILHKCGKIH